MENAITRSTLKSVIERKLARKETVCTETYTQLSDVHASTVYARRGDELTLLAGFWS